MNNALAYLIEYSKFILNTSPKDIREDRNNKKFIKYVKNNPKICLFITYIYMRYKNKYPEMISMFISELSKNI